MFCADIRTYVSSLLALIMSNWPCIDIVQLFDSVPPTYKCDIITLLAWSREGADGTSELRTAIQRYRDTAGGRWADFDPDSCSWSHVFQELNEAKSVYEELGAKSRIRRAFRHGSGISRNITPLLDGIPQEDGLGLIKGGLKILFNVRPSNQEPSDVLSLHRLILMFHL